MKHRDAPYYADELVRHRHWDDAKKEWSVRTVKFIDYDDAELGWARVSFGARPGDTGLVPQVFRVPVAEIARPMPKEPIFAPPPAPKPSDGTISAPDLAPLRQALRAAQEARATQQ